MNKNDSHSGHLLCHYLDKHDLLDQYMNEIYEFTTAQERVPSQQRQAAAHPFERGEEVVLADADPITQRPN